MLFLRASFLEGFVGFFLDSKVDESSFLSAGSDENDEDDGEARKSAFRTPSRERKRIVESRSSNWIAAVPNT